MPSNYTPEYTVYSILGKADSEQEKLQYSLQWMKCYSLLDRFMSECKSKSISTVQKQAKIAKITEDGSFKVTYKNAMSSGVLKWSYENNRAVCEAHMQAHLLDMQEYEKSGLDFNQWLSKRFPAKSSYLQFGSTCVRASLESFPKNAWNEGYDFSFMLSRSSDIKSHPVYNQEVTIAIHKRLSALKKPGVQDELIEDIAKLSNAVKVGKTMLPYRIDLGTPNNPIVRFLLANEVEGGYGLIQQQVLAFRENPVGKWETIFEKK